MSMRKIEGICPIMTLETDIRAWDGKSTDDILAIYRTHQSSNALIENVLSALHDSTTCKGASWILKHHLESGCKISQWQLDRLFSGLDELSSWESRLHILQLLQYVELMGRNKMALERFMRRCLVDNNKFVRAWAYNGFYLLATCFPEYEKEVRHFFEMALHDEAPSVKARIRNIMKQGFLNDD